MNAHIKKLAVVILICSIPFGTYAWGVLGHRIVGGIADKYLTKSARKEINKLLGNESPAMVANWMDFIKSDTNYRHLGSWHYVNIKSGTPADVFFQQLQQDTTANIYSRINYLVTQLKSKNGDQSTRAQYLKMLIHLIGDLHQPMHVGRPEDLGGNRIKLQWFGDNVNLHQVWDEKLVNFQQLSYTEYIAAINFSSTEQRKLWQKEPLLNWMWESYQLAELIYADVKPEEKLSYNYNFKHIDTVNNQLLKGGIRLAGVLNDIFG